MRLRLLWGLLLVACSIAWTSWAGGLPWLPVLTYWAAWAWAIVVPGVLVHRSLRGRPADLVSDLALGAGVGLVLQLSAWAVLTGLGLQQHLLWWPAAVVLLFGAVPRLRRHYTLARYASVLPTGAAAVAALAFAVVLHQLTDTFRDFSLPPGALSWYQDDLWNLGNVAELMRTVTPQVAQVAGDPFHYHWFSDAHLAAMSLTTSIDPVLVVARLWAAPVLLLIVGLGVAVGRRLSGSAWVGAGVAVCFTLAPSLQVSWFAFAGASPNALRSPSQVFAVPLVLLAIDLLTSLLRHARSWGGWALLAPVLLACAGAKSSALPVLAGGLALAGAVALVVARRRLRMIVPAIALLLTVVLVTRSRLAGGENGSGLQLFATFVSSAPWERVHDGRANRLSTGAIISGLGAPGAGWVLTLVVGCALVSYLWVLVGVPALRRTDLAGWFLLGTGLAGLAALLLIRHPAYSQIYFLKVAIPAWHLLALWGLQRSVGVAVERTSRRETARVAVGGVAVGALLLGVARSVGGPPSAASPAEDVGSSIQWSLLVALAAVAVALALLATRRRRSEAAGALLVVGISTATLSAAILGVTAEPVIDAMASSGSARAAAAGALVVVVVVVAGRSRRAARVLGRPLPSVWWAPTGLTGLTVLLMLVVSVTTYLGRGIVSPPDPDRLVTTDEVVAARWLNAHADPFDTVATNVHCRPTRTAVHCDARAFWVSGLAGRRVLVEGWGYTDAAQGANGRNGLSFSEQPFENPALLALNDGVFSHPTRADAQALYAMGVRWLFADALAGPVSARLAAVASPAFRSGPVTVYRLESPGTAISTR